MCRIWCRKHSFIYQSLSISTVADPLSADLIKMSSRFLSDLRACRSREVKLSSIGSGFTLRKSCSTASKKVSSAISRCGGGLQVLFGRNGLGLAWGGWLARIESLCCLETQNAP